MAFLNSDMVVKYCRRFNGEDRELYVYDIPDKDAAEFLAEEAPRFECPDPVLTEIWHFRWWSFRKHIRTTPFGRVILEFLPPVGWAGPFNTINCPAAHQLREARWFRDKGIAEEYMRFWMNPEAHALVRKYTFGAASAALDVAAVTGNTVMLKDLSAALEQNYAAWKRDHQLPDGLFIQSDNYDGMEESIGGSGIRATINSCMTGEAYALGLISGKLSYTEEGRQLQRKMEDTLWNPEAGFFMTRHTEDRSFVNVRELHGYTPWYYLDMDPKYDRAWKFLTDPDGFSAPYGLTTAEQRHPEFQISLEGHDCKWNGPVWPFATSVTLTALARLLHQRTPESVSRRAYFLSLMTYARSHYLTENGRTVPWIDEDQDPFTGSWLAREIRQRRDSRALPLERGKDYSHSTFADMVITGLCGLDTAGGSVSADPLLPQNCWDYFLLDGIRINGHEVALQYDRDGTRYSRGSGLTLYIDGESAACGPLGTRISAEW